MTAARFTRLPDGRYQPECPDPRCTVENPPATRFRDVALRWAQRHVCARREGE